MKKLFLATPKKLLLATSILAMSSTAIAATSALVDSAKTDTLTVTAHYVEPLTMSLDLATINFGDVWTDSVVTAETVTASLTGTTGETFDYDITTDGSLVLLDGAALALSGSSSITGLVGSGVGSVSFTVGLDTSLLTEDVDVTEVVTVSVQYNDIAGTTTGV
jgi:hypothetical protein